MCVEAWERRKEGRESGGIIMMEREKERQREEIMKMEIEIAEENAIEDDKDKK